MYSASSPRLQILSPKIPGAAHRSVSHFSQIGREHNGIFF
jgi:hypothetical protein